MKNLTWQNPGQLFVAQELIKIVKLKCCGIKVLFISKARFVSKVVNGSFCQDTGAYWNFKVVRQPVDVLPGSDISSLYAS